MTKELIKELLGENSEFVKNIGQGRFEGLEDSQSPTITLLSCSDSRVPVNMVSHDTINKIFSIENIGNQIKTSEGSVDYGVLHLHTPLLVVMGHTGCGAIKSCFSDFTKENEGIVRELEFLTGGLAEMDNSFAHDDSERIEKYAELNVDYQILYAAEKYRELVENERLSIIGLMADLNCTYGEEKGKVYITNFNCETVTGKINEKLKLDNTQRIKRLV
ncbi:MAG: carbonic anhydrase [Nanoarchaeota archaeon]